MMAHVSHRMGRIAGVACCTICYVEPDWPLASLPCSREGIGQARRATYTPTRIRGSSASDARVIRALERGAPLKAIKRELRAGEMRIKRLAAELGIPLRPQGRPRKAAA